MTTQNSTSESVMIVESYFNSLRTGDMETLNALLAEDVTWYQPGNGSLSGRHEGKQEVFSLFGKFMEISEGSFKIDQVESIMANGDFVCATLRFSAHKKDGSRILMAGVDVMKIENGKIKEVCLFSSDQAAEDLFWG